MATMNTHSPSEADPLDAVVESFLQRYRRGEHPTVTEYVERYPDLAERIRETFPALAMIEELGSVGSPAGAAAPIDETIAPLASPPGYELRDEIGRGGMGIVYRARDTALDRDVAVKLLSNHYPADSPVAQRFLSEARITGQLQHPGIPAVHQAGTLADGRPFLAMKLIKGSTLEAILKQRTDPAAERGRLLAIFEAVCQAVGYAHAHHVIHRDLKPANIMVGAFGEVQVMDWGLAKVLGEERPASAYSQATEETRGWTEVSPRPEADLHTQTGSLVGTPAFIAPEQAVGEIERVNERSDVFGLGALLAVILTGKPPYTGETPESVRVQAVRGKLDDCFARLDASGAEQELVSLCKKCLAFEPADRPADAGAVAEAVAWLRAAADERARRAELERVRLEGEQATAQARSAERRKRLWLLLGAAAVLATVLIAFMVTLVVYDVRLQEEIRKQGHQIIELNTNLGIKNEEVGDTFAAILRYTEALKYDEILAQDQQMDRMRITMALRQCPRLVHLQMMDGPALCTNFDEGGSLVATVDGPTIKVQDYLTRESTAPAIAVAEPVQKGSISKDGRYLATLYANGTATVWELSSGKSFALQWPNQQPIQDLAFHSEPAILVTHHPGSVVRLWSQTDQGPVRMEKIAIEPASFSVLSENGKWLCALDAGGMAHVHSLGLADAATAAFKVNDQVRIGAISSDGARLALLGKTGTGDVWDTKSGERLGKPLPLHQDMSRLLFSPDGERLFAGGPGAAAVWNARSGELLAELSPLPAAFTDAGFSNDGRLLLLTGPHESRVWDSKSGQCVTPLLEHGRPHTAAFTPDGTEVIVADRAGMIQGWQVPTPLDAENQPASEFDGDLTQTVAMRVPGLPGQVAISPDGARAVSCENQRVARLSHRATGLSWLLEHKAPLICGAFSPDGRYFVTASTDRAIRVWDVTTGKPLSPPLRHASAIKSVAFRKTDSSKALVYHENGTLSTWNLSPDNQHTVKQLMALAQLLTASRIDEQEDQKPLEMKDLRSAWDRTERIRQEMITP
jgi:serine/threonine protein kinase/WD40 repeat protein